MSTANRERTPQITRESLRNAPKTLVMREELPRGGAMFEWRCDRHPRLVQHYYRGTSTAKARISWNVDGVRCADLDEAVRLLNGPVIAEDQFEAAAS